MVCFMIGPFFTLADLLYSVTQVPAAAARGISTLLNAGTAMWSHKYIAYEHFGRNELRQMATNVCSQI